MLIHNLLDTSKLQTGKFSLNMEEIDLTVMIREIVERFALQLRKANCTVTLDLSEKIVGKLDRIRIEQILANLISNVIYHAPGCPVKISAMEHDNKVRLVVQDFGPGITTRDQGKVFDSYERGGSAHNESGLGLGLYIVKRIVEAHQGSIRLESEPGHGSKFIIELPLRSPNNGVQGAKRQES